MQIMEILKKEIIIVLALIGINYAFNVGKIIAIFDVSMQKWNVILMQLNENRERYLAKYKNNI